MKRLNVNIIALTVAVISLGWQIFDAINQKVSKLDIDIVFVRSPNDGKIDMKCITKNIGYKPIYLDYYSFRVYKENNSNIYNEIKWTKDINSNVIESGQSISASLEFKNLDELRKFLVLGKKIVF
ncbi:MAG: hypothetical protein Q6358_05950, partial [Candidatus Brocadiales bacterium]|nr:hypothetical protein [Candidatus Brocadiales bacterium]